MNRAYGFAVSAVLSASDPVHCLDVDLPHIHNLVKSILNGSPCCGP